MVRTLVSPTAQKDNFLEHSRIRAAWRAARLVTAKTEERKASGLADDLDVALDGATHKQLSTNFQANHNFVSCMHMAPCDALIIRLFRENQRSQAPVVAVRKVQSLAAASLPA